MNLRLAPVLLSICATTGCGTIAGWSATNPDDVSRGFIGTRVDAAWMTNSVPNSLEDAFWGFRQARPAGQGESAIRCWYFMDMPFSVGADLLMLPAALIVSLF